MSIFVGVMDQLSLDMKSVLQNHSSDISLRMSPGLAGYIERQHNIYKLTHYHGIPIDIDASTDMYEISVNREVRA